MIRPRNVTVVHRSSVPVLNVSLIYKSVYEAPSYSVYCVVDMAKMREKRILILYLVLAPGIMSNTYVL
jgi:hypothetical protein